jgi:cholesterol transport system auxiliary component
MTWLYRSLTGLTLLALSGCGSILTPPTPPPALYRLTPATDFAAPARALPLQLAVDVPSAEAALDTTRIALSRSPTTLDYFAASAWTDRLTTSMQALLIATLDNAHGLAAVGPAAGALRADVVLLTELRHFEAVYGSAGPPQWHIDITAKLVKLPERTILAEREFVGDKAASRNDLPAIVEASDLAWHEVGKNIADWTATTLAPIAH